MPCGAMGAWAAVDAAAISAVLCSSELPAGGLPIPGALALLRRPPRRCVCRAESWPLQEKRPWRSIQRSASKKCFNCMKIVR